MYNRSVSPGTDPSSKPQLSNFSFPQALKNLPGTPR